MAGPKAPTSLSIGRKDPGIQHTTRFAVRVVTFNRADKMALVHAPADADATHHHHHWELPGAAFDPAEEHAAAVRRAVAGALGARAAPREDVGCVATAEEFRGGIHLMSYCYVADVASDHDDDDDDDDGEEEEVSFAESEAEHGGQGRGEGGGTGRGATATRRHKWVAPKVAKMLMGERQPASEAGLLAKERDMHFLKEARKVLLRMAPPAA
ncbi:hypothetical protein P8C59_009464 [Phyllachora maydis]|uniref:Nudix hydrolase domain-containing protein n=1 Tax=Phyllachora maydis TaxID=1825666 RepID=A0AAD9MLA7_9PEZI|nr:hypothetical protein P8C59_009464 [Phyllachora maydis]